jgi:multidrug efflux pump subunit AcrA (membrane-fusion protein)
VPADALVTFAGTEKVFLVVTNRALERPITSGRRMDGWIEVLKGLKPGEVVIRQPGGLQTGEPVRPAADTGTVGATNTVNAR